MVHLPQELVIEILLRLPVKSLIRFKCVCKSWLSIISDSHFSVSHFELSATHTERLMFFDPSTPKIGSIDFHASLYDDSAFAVLSLNFLPTKPYNLRFRGSCRGFVVLECCRSVWMWNPSTGVHKQLPDSPIVSSRDDIFLTFLYGFGYDPSTDDYLVLKLSYKPFSSHIANRVHIFSLRANMWTEVEGTRLFYMNSGNNVKAGTLFNGALHWLAYRSSISKNVILAFDLTIRTFSEIPLPVEFELDFNNFDLVVLGKFPSSLCVVKCFPSAEIWVMKEYKVQSSWTKTIVVSIDDIPTQYFSPICSTNCSDIVGIDGNTGLAKCNDKGMLQEHRYCSPYRSDELAVGEDIREFLSTLLEEGRSFFGPNQLEVALYTESLLQLSYEL